MAYKKSISQLVAAFGFVSALSAAINVDFGDLNSLPVQVGFGGDFYNGDDLSGTIGSFDGSFTSGGVQFTNNFTRAETFSFWNGWAYSTTTDTITPGFGNQYSAFTGGGNGDDAYGIYSLSNGPTMSLGLNASAPQSMFITNTTYAFLAMRDGNDGNQNPFVKQPGFGGVSGDDEDFFLLTITGLDANNSVTGTVDFYLADYRFSDNSLDYIVDTWTEVDLTGLGTGVSSIQFELDSSDVGSFGINTPGYFAMDDFTAVPEPSTFALLTGVFALLILAKRRRV